MAITPRLYKDLGPQTISTVGRHAFPVADACIQNDLPLDVTS